MEYDSKEDILQESLLRVKQESESGLRFGILFARSFPSPEGEHFIRQAARLDGHDVGLRNRLQWKRGRGGIWRIISSFIIQAGRYPSQTFDKSTGLLEPPCLYDNLPL